MGELADDERIADLRRIGLAEPILRSAAGDVLHDGLWSVFNPLPRTTHEPPTPAGSRFVPMWSFRGSVIGAMVWHDHVHFAEYAIEFPDDGFELVAHTEQGLLAYHLFVEVLDEYLEGASRSVDFRFLDEVKIARESRVSVAVLVARIDAQSKIS